MGEGGGGDRDEVAAGWEIGLVIGAEIFLSGGADSGEFGWGD